MNVSRFDKATAVSAHEGTILASDVLPAGMKAPFGHAWGYLDRPGQMDTHSHPTSEVYLFFEGDGIVVVDGEKRAVSCGDVVQIPPNAPHTVINEKGGKLLWAALWWND